MLRKNKIFSPFLATSVIFYQYALIGFVFRFPNSFYTHFLLFLRFLSFFPLSSGFCFGFFWFFREYFFIFAYVEF